METYKIGNKINCILRTLVPGKIGGHNFTYANEPYTVLYDKEATLTFRAQNTTATRTDKLWLSYNTDCLQEVRITDVELTSKILDLIFEPKEIGLSTHVTHAMSDNEGKIYLNKNENWFQVFIYDVHGDLEQAYGTLESDILDVQLMNSDYLVVYSLQAISTYNLNKGPNLYMRAELEIIGNQENSTHNMCVCIEKCGLRIDKTMYFNRNANAADIVLIVINDEPSYLAVE